MEYKKHLIVFIGTLILGLIINGLYGPHQFQGDEKDYHELAQHFSQTREYGTPGQKARKAPLYSIALGFVYKAFGDSQRVARIFQSILGALMATLTFAFGKKIWGERCGWLAVFLLCLNSFWWFNQKLVMQENFYSVLLCLTAFFLLLAIAQQQVKFFALAGFVFGLSLLTKPTAVPALLLIMLFVFLKRKSKDKISVNISQATIFCVASLIVITPWAMRNFKLFNHFVPFTTGTGQVLSNAHHPDTLAKKIGSGVSQHNQFSVQEKETFAKMDPFQAEWHSDQMLKSKAWSYMSDIKSKEWTELLIFKALRFISPSVYFDTSTYWTNGIKKTLISCNVLILIAFFVSLFKQPHSQIPLLFFISLLITSLIFWGSIRFRYPLSPLIAAWASAQILDVMKIRKN